MEMRLLEGSETMGPGVIPRNERADHSLKGNSRSSGSIKLNLLSLYLLASSIKLGVTGSAQRMLIQCEMKKSGEHCETRMQENIILSEN